ncbi:MAG: host specificity factor TipJ family phage tail protein [Bauldia sp.]
MTTSSFRRARRPAPRMMVLANALQREATTVTFERPVTIADAIRRQRLSFRLPVVAVVTDGDGDGVPVLRAEWTRRKIRRGETLVFVGVPGKDGGSILGIIAGIALAVVAPWAGGAIAGALFGGSAIAASLISTGIILGGSFIINALFGPPKPEAFAAGERVSLANASANQARPLGIVPCLYGLMRYPPPPASIAYSEFDGNDQLLYQLHCVSVGVANPKRWEIGKTLAWTSAGGFTSSFTGIDIEIIRPGDAITLFPANVVVAETVARQVVPDPPDVLGPFTINDAGTQISEIAVDIEFPAGLYARKGNGGAGDASRQLTSRFREIDDEGAPLGDWSLLFVLTFTRSTATPQRFTRRATVPPGRYEVTLEAGDEDTSDDGPINRVAWAGLRGYLTNWTVPPGVTLIATKIRANDQLSQQSASQYFFTCQRCLPIYDVESQTWSAPAETSAIAWAAADILRNTDYGAGIDDALYDLAWLAAYDEVWSGRGDAFNGILDDGRPIGDALDTVLRAGRAYKVRLGGRIGFNRDEPKQIKRHVFGPGNTLRGSHGRKDVWFDEETPDPRPRHLLRRRGVGEPRGGRRDLFNRCRGSAAQVLRGDHRSGARLPRGDHRRRHQRLPPLLPVVQGRVRGPPAHPRRSGALP